MRGKMLFVSIALLVMLFFVETASAQVNVATLKQLQAALAGNDEEIIVTKTIVIDEDLTLDGGERQSNSIQMRAYSSSIRRHLSISRSTAASFSGAIHWSLLTATGVLR